MVVLTLGGQRVLVACPEGPDRGRLAIEMIDAYSAARAENAAACVLRRPALAAEPMFSLVPDGVTVVRPRGAAAVRARWGSTLGRASERMRVRLADARAGFWLECYRELRRHAGNERLPLDFRGQLRRAAHRSFSRAETAERSRGGPTFPRAQIRNAMPMRLPEELFERARSDGRQLGVPSGPLVAIDVRGHVHEQQATLDAIARAGLAPVHLGSAPLVDLFVLLTSAFLLCDNADAQRLAYLTGTPTLTINATDALSFYPVRPDGLYLLKDVVDLDSGRVLPLEERLGESYYRNLRNYGFRSVRGAVVRAAVEEMLAGCRNGWSDTAGQARVRALAGGCGVLASRVRHIAKWGPVDGFIGDGRLARVQAEAIGAVAA